ncbi:cation:proton antiporter [Dankookia sp. P2]|uniref:cation:proton antiporter n=1 Tax=Dankookia sp. P2 TaxID=3423955 RepID=UPI003D66415E
MPIATLALVAVGLTVAVVAVIARWSVPDMPWAAAVTLGAIVAPPDASAATAVLKRLRPPHRIVVILEGESLFNDASALLVYRIAVAATLTGSFSLLQVAPLLLLTAGGGALAGRLAARLYLAVAQRLTSNIAIVVLVQFLGTFAVWLLAEALHLSSIITVVVFGMTLARHVPRVTSAQHRIGSYAVWEVSVFVLNAVAFLLIGLQMRAIVGRVDGNAGMVIWLAFGTCLAVVVTRIVWVMIYNAAYYLWTRRYGPPVVRGKRVLGPSAARALVISWSGMRGVVTLATALALPEGFPYRDEIVFAAVCVVLITLGLQGSTLGPLLRRLHFPDDGILKAEIGTARGLSAEAAIRLVENAPPSTAREALLREWVARRNLHSLRWRRCRTTPSGCRPRQCTRRAKPCSRCGPRARSAMTPST